MFLKLFLFDLVEAEDILWFDADYGCLSPWEPREGYDGTFTAVRDRTALLLEADDVRSASIMNYFNTGFFIANRTRHRALFEQAREQWRGIPWKWTDQCLLNAVFERTGTPVRYLDRRFNCMNFGPAMQESDVRAVHCSSNYEHYRKGTSPTATARYVWDAAAMHRLAGWYNLEYRDGWASMALFYDGTTSDGHLWFATSDTDIHFASITGEWTEQPLHSG